MFMVGYASGSGYRFFAPQGNRRSFLMSGVRMHRWSALVEIVKSFNERGSPRLAFASVVLFAMFPLVALALALSLGASAFPQLP